MHWLLRILLVLALACCSWLPAAAAQVVDVTAAGDGDPTRLTIYTRTAHEAEGFLTLTPSGMGLVIGLPGAAFQSEPRILAAAGRSGVTGWQGRDHSVAFGLSRPMQIARLFTLEPSGAERRHRIIADLRTVSPHRFERRAARDAEALGEWERQLPALALAPPAAAPAPDLPEAGRPPPALIRAAAESGGIPAPVRRANAKPVIVIDPGHGGKDPGATANGVIEKEIVLKASLELRDLLLEDGRYTVRLTRDTDVFIELPDRPSMAREWGANLFLSIHADAAGPRARGASVYTLSPHGQKRMDGAAAKNNWVLPTPEGASETVAFILEDMLKSETKTHSGAFAKMLLPRLAEAGPLIKNSHRNKSLYVLLAPDVPAVLLELGFLTHPSDAKRLNNGKERRKIVRAVKKAIDSYFEGPGAAGAMR